MMGADLDQEKLAVLLPAMRGIPQRVRQLLELVLEVRETFDSAQIPDWLDEMRARLEQLELHTRSLTHVVELLDFITKAGQDDVG